MLLDTVVMALDECIFPYEIVEKGQGELGLDYIDIVKYMQDNGHSDKQINTCFKVYTSKNIIVTT